MLIKKIGFVASCFDLLHAGHCLMLKDAREQCDHLIAALQVDPSVDRPDKNKPIQSLDERRIQLESLKYVDEIQLYETENDLRVMLGILNPDIRILGSDYIDKPCTGKDLDIEIYYHERSHPWSTTELRKRIVNASSKK